ncbi:MAG: nucleoside-diphosphate kinase [Candidatus Omnitrophica bacterium]|nr:nucleoside-diphosphate kinase [Candidatus Omnitrophota bacterium]
MANQATLVIIKPDAIKRGLMGATLSKLEPLQLEIIGAKVMPVSRELAEAHYSHIKEKPFFSETVEHLRGTLHGVPYVVAFVLWGPDAVERVRLITGATNPEKADPLTIRGALGRNTASGLMENVMHSSADPADAEREIGLWFKPHELLCNPFAGAGVGARPSR